MRMRSTHKATLPAAISLGIIAPAPNGSHPSMLMGAGMLEKICIISSGVFPESCIDIKLPPKEGT